MDRDTAKKLIEIRNSFIMKHNRVVLEIFAPPKEKTLSYRYGLTNQQDNTVAFLYYGGAKQISEIAVYQKIDISNATKLANVLVAKGLCEKHKEKGKRAVFLSLTEEGKTVYEEIANINIDILMYHYNKRFSLDEQEKYYQLLESLNELSARLLVKDI